MPNFWSFIGNEKYDIGCTGQTVYLYDKQGNEIAKFKDLPYAYTSAISPNGDIFVVKTTEGRLAVYSLESATLIKKFRFSKVDGGQDDNFCFSPDSTEFYNIERHIDSCKTALSIYNTSDFSLKRRILNDDFSVVLTAIEYSQKTNEIFLLGYFRGENGVASRFFVAKLEHDNLNHIVTVPEKEFRFYSSYIGLKMHGFTQKTYKWSYICAELEDLKSSDLSLYELWSRYSK